MANHAYVKTRKKMTVEAISAMLDRLNKTVFRNCIKVDYIEKPDEKFWSLSVVHDGKDCYSMHRVFWLNTSRSFELRHGGGGIFLFWIDAVICNEIALLFNGKINDDGPVEVRKNMPKFRHFQLICTPFYQKRKDGDFDAAKENLARWSWMQMEQERVPPPFKNQNWRFFVSLEKPDHKTFNLVSTVNPKYA